MKKNKLDIAKNLLSSGELVIFPTETVFGLGADATNDEAVKSIFKVKKRPRSNPIICHFKSIKQIEKYFILNKFEKKLGSKFWPGPLTIILKKKKNSKISKLVSNNSTLVGCRIPGNKLAKKLITLFDLPIAAPSANLSERTSVTNIMDIDPILVKKIFVLKDCSIHILTTFQILAFNSQPFFSYSHHSILIIILLLVSHKKTCVTLSL